MLAELEHNLEKLRMETLLSGEYSDRYNAILRLNAGAGGTESCDWCGVLLRMYCLVGQTRWASRLEVLDYLDGDEAGIKSVTIQINGENAFGYLEVRGKVCTVLCASRFSMRQASVRLSFVSCDVMPDIEEDLDVDINPDDLRIDTYRSSGAGGQHIDKTLWAMSDGASPTGIVVQCRN